MYTTFYRFFGLRENPFNINPDPNYLYLDQRIQTVLDNMASAIEARKGLIVLTGEPGTGKTTLINRLMQWLQEQKTPTAFIFNPHIELNDLFDMLFADFGIATDARHTRNPWMRLSHWSIEQYRMGINAVIILDEAQGLPVPLLGEIRLLLNHEIGNEGLIQIVLSGQPELEAKLKKPELRQVRQRISLRCQTAALTLEQAHAYVRKRIQLAGGVSENVFAREAIDAAHHYSQGIPRLMNLLSEHAMIRAFLSEVHSVSVSMVEEAARLLQFDDAKPAGHRPTLEPSLWGDSAVGLSGPVADRTAAVELSTEEHKVLPVPISVVRESTKRAMFETAVDAQQAPMVTTASAKPSESHMEGAIAPSSISQLKAKTDSTQDLMADWFLREMPNTSRVTGPKNWKRRATVFSLHKENHTRTLPDLSRIRRLLLTYLSWGRGLRTSLDIPYQRILRGWREVFALPRLREWQTVLRSALRWLRASFPSARNSVEKKNILELARSVVRLTNLQSAVRWLQQPLPALKPHRRVSR